MSSVTIRISDDDKAKIEEIAKIKSWKYNIVLSKSINNYYNAVVGNRIKKGK